MIRFLLAFIMIPLFLQTWPIAHSIAADVQSFFSPRGQSLVELCRRFDSAKTTISIATFQITNVEFCKHISSAKNRGVEVTILIDRGQIKSASANLTMLRRSGIKILVDQAEKLFHNKYILIDGHVTITGSYNFSDNAELRNAENFVVIYDESVYDSFFIDFNKHLSHSRAYVKPGVQSSNNSSRLAFTRELNSPFLKKEPRRWQKLQGR
jgi:phosphatidylserine/phosphatidylglycerophosphate/cardiolipin synthase-like enzyme